jgi:hypothetical protein
MKKKPYSIKAMEQGRIPAGTDKFATLAEASQFIQDRWQGAEYIDCREEFHTDYCTYTLRGFTLRDIGIMGVEEGCRTFTFHPLEALAARPARIYLALHEGGLENGSFFRQSEYTDGGWAQYINGDFMGRQPERPTTYAGHPLREFPQDIAEKLIPSCCR